MFILPSLVEKTNESWQSKSIRLWFCNSRIEKNISKESLDLEEGARTKDPIHTN
jgi:hypothetical protein